MYRRRLRFDSTRASATRLALRSVGAGGEQDVSRQVVQIFGGYGRHLSLAFRDSQSGSVDARLAKIQGIGKPCIEVRLELVADALGKCGEVRGRGPLCQYDRDTGAP